MTCVVRRVTSKKSSRSDLIVSRAGPSKEVDGRLLEDVSGHTTLDRFLLPPSLTIVQEDAVRIGSGESSLPIGGPDVFGGEINSTEERGADEVRCRGMKGIAFGSGQLEEDCADCLLGAFLPSSAPTMNSTEYRSGLNSSWAPVV